MKTLILMRHAKSSWNKPGLSDHDRPLNGRGHRSAQAMGNWLRERGYTPDAALSSTARRTAETFEELAFDCPVRFTPALYHAEAETMLAELMREQADTVLMIGHNPGIADCAERIVAGPPDHARFWDYPTCATLVVRFAAAEWTDIRWGSGEAVEFAIPREILGDT